MDDEDAISDEASWLRAIAHVPVEDAPGKTVGRYRIERMLGKGGMGVVHLALDQQLSRTVALKLLPAESVGDEQRRRRFLREARIAAKLSDPRIATVYDAGRDGDRIFLAMEYVRGETLRERLRREGALAIDDAVAIASAVAGALAHAHTAGVVHRDIKPDNVMLADAGGVKVLDFGAAKVAARDEGLDADGATTVETREGTLLGTPAYMSPEQAKGVTVDARTDVFALGVTLYEMIAGKRPFDGATPFEVLVAIERDDPQRLRRVRRETPEWLEAVVARCLEKDPARRFGSGDELRSALESGPVATRHKVARYAVAASLATLALVATSFASRRPDPPVPPAPASREAPPVASIPAPVASTSLPRASASPATSAAPSPVRIAPRPSAARPPAQPPTPGPGPLDEPK